MEKPTEDIRLLNVFMRDLQENVKKMETDFYERINSMQKEIDELKRKVNTQKIK